jgi:hypothetical protein
MGNEQSINAGIHEPHVIFDISPAGLDAGGFWPVGGGIANNLATQIPYRTTGWNEMFGYVASDRAFTFRVYWGRSVTAVDNNVVLQRLTATEADPSNVDPVSGQEVVPFVYPIVAPWVLFEVENTSGIQAAYLEIYIAFRV